MIVTEQKEAARILGVTARTLRDWRRAYPDEFPDTSAGYNIEVLKEFQKSLSLKGSEHGDRMRMVKLAREAVKLQREKIAVRREERALQTQEGGLLPRSSFELFVANVLSGFGDWCEQLPDLIAGGCCKKCQRSIGPRIKAELDRRREQLAEDLKRSSQEG